MILAFAFFVLLGSIPFECVPITRLFVRRHLSAALPRIDFASACTPWIAKGVPPLSIQPISEKLSVKEVINNYRRKIKDAEIINGIQDRRINYLRQMAGYKRDLFEHLEAFQVEGVHLPANSLDAARKEAFFAQHELNKMTPGLFDARYPSDLDLKYLHQDLNNAAEQSRNIGELRIGPGIPAWLGFLLVENQIQYQHPVLLFCDQNGKNIVREPDHTTIIIKSDQFEKFPLPQ